MTKDILFTLPGHFMLNLTGPLHCPECAMVEGVLSYFPQVRAQLDIRTIPFERPRPEIVALLGEDHQGCPCLILANSQKGEGLPVKESGGYAFLDDHKAILEYLAREYGTSRPAHD